MKDSNDYLWSGAGDPDPDVARLEALLSGYRHRGTLPPLPQRDGVRPRRRVPVVLQLLTAAASIALVVAAARYALTATPTGWRVQPIAGSPAVTGRMMMTDSGSRARIDVGDIGEVEVEPNSRVRFLRSRTDEHRMALDRGRIHARIWAPPGQFYVNTPAATAVDLGCAYTLQVDPEGWGVLHVDLGWVAFEYGGRESFIPKDAVCATRPGLGPGTPHYEDVAPEVEDALTILDFSPTQDVRRKAALDAVLAHARPRDALTLWHLLSRGSLAERSRVYDAMAALVPPPAGVNRDAVLRGDAAALDAWWNALGLDSASWWRIWKAPWRQ
jgi:FecR protein